MPFLGLATTGDLEKKTSGLATTGDLEKKTSCTQIINGVHICSIPKYDKIVKPNDFKFGSVIDSSEKVCLHFDHIDDVVGTARATAMSNMIGHGDIPDNYVCVDAAATTQYFKAIVPEKIQPMAKGFLDTFGFDDFRKDDEFRREERRGSTLGDPESLRKGSRSPKLGHQMVEIQHSRASNGRSRKK